MSDLHEENVEDFDIKDSAAAREESSEPDKVEYIEFLGTDPGLHGTTLHTSHSVSKAHFKQYHDVVTDKDLTWTKGSNGRFLVPVGDMSPEAAEVLAKDPMFKRVKV